MNVELHPDRADPDNIVIRWGETGRAHVVAKADEQAMMKAWKDAVAEGLALGDRIEDASDRSVAREVQERVGIRVAKAGGGLIVAYWPNEEVAAKLSALIAGVEGAISLNDLHLTLLYLDSPEGLEANEWDIELVAAVCKIFSTRHAPREAAITGIGRFVGPEDTDAVIALIDSAHLAYFRNCLKDELIYAGALPNGAACWDEEHGFIPHVTLAYVAKDVDSPSSIPALVEFELDNIALARGSNRVVFELREYANEMSEMAEAPVYRARRSLEKAGRVLSGQNLQAVEEAIAALNDVAARERARGLTPEDDEETTEKRRKLLEAVSGEEGEAETTYLVTKATEDRYTFGPLYAPNRKDAHGEYVEDEELQKAVWDYVRTSAKEGRRLNLQHGDLGDITVAEWVEVVTWPYEHTIKVKTADGTINELEMPANTVYLGAVWDEDTWPLVKSGKLNGWSLGGRAVKVKSDKALKDMVPMGARKDAHDREMAMLKVAATAEAELRERELEGARKESGRLESIVGQLVDAVKTYSSREVGDVHSHVHLAEGAVDVTLPPVSVDVKPELKLDVVE